jgi:hypothetical protein
MDTRYDEFRATEAQRFAADLDRDLRVARPGESLPRLDAIEGSDATGTVYCVVGLDAKVRRVVITDGWWHQLGPRGVAQAVLQALSWAEAKTGVAQTMLVDRGFPLPEPQRQPASEYDDQPLP